MSQRLSLFGLVVLVLATTDAQADTYTYQGKPFTSFTVNGNTPASSIAGISATDYVTATITTKDPWGGKISNPPDNFSSWSFAVGAYSWSSANGDSFAGTYCEIDSNGNMVEWDFPVLSGSGTSPSLHLIFSLNTGTRGDFFVANTSLPGGQGLDLASNSTPGVWTYQPAAAVPEPTSLLILGTGLGVIGLAAWRRRT